MTSVLLGASLVAYFIASMFYLANLHIKRGPIATYGTVAAIAGFVLQSARLAIQISARSTPFANPMEAVFFLSWAIVGTYLIVLAKFRLPAVGALAMPLSVVALALAYRLRGETGQPFAGDLWLRLHVIAIVMSFAIFTLSFCCAVFYLVQNSLLKSKHITGMFRRLPPLETVGSLAFHLAAIGFPLLTLGIVMGVVGVGPSAPATHDSHVRLVIACVTWAVYAAYLISHGAAGWRGKRSNWILVLGAVLIAITTALHGFVRR